MNASDKLTFMGEAKLRVNNFCTGDYEFKASSESGVETILYMDLNSCSSNEILRDGATYSFEYDEVDGKNCIKEFSRSVKLNTTLPMFDMNMNMQTRILNVGDDEIMDRYVEGPKIVSPFLGQVIGVEDGLVIFRNKESFCANVHPDDIEKWVFEENHWYRGELTITSSGAYVNYSKDLECQETCENNNEHIIVRGRTKYIRQPKLGDEFLNIKVLQEGKTELEVELCLSDDLGDVLLEDNIEYTFLIEKLESKNRLRKILFPHRGEHFVIPNGVDYLINLRSFERVCREFYNGGALVMTTLEGAVLEEKKHGKLTELIISEDGQEVRCVYNENGAETLKSFHVGVCVQIKALLKEDHYIIFSIVESRVLKAIDDICADKPLLKEEFRGLSDQQQQTIFNIVTNFKKEGKTDHFIGAAFNESDMELKYKICREYYPLNIQRAVDGLLDSNSRERLAHKRQLLELLINTDWGRTFEKEEFLDYDLIVEKLDKTHYGQEHLKCRLAQLISDYFNKTHGQRGKVVLLCGSHGVGKTSIAERLAEIVGLPFDKISLNGVSGVDELKGTPRIYENARCGRLLQSIHRIGGQGIILLDQVDKMEQRDSEGNPYTALYGLLDSSKTYEDTFAEVSLPVNDIFFILTAESIEKIPSTLLEQIEIINIPDYSEKERIDIAEKYIIPKTMKKYNWDRREVLWEKEAIDRLANRYTLSNGLYEIEENIDTIIGCVFEKMEKESGTRLVVNSKCVEKMIGTTPWREGDTAYSITELKHKFLWYKDFYTKTTAIEIMKLIRQYDTSLDEKEKGQTKKRLFPLVNYVPLKVSRKLNLSKVKRHLDKTHMGLENEKMQLLMKLSAINSSSTDKIQCFLFDGPCGTGKTTLAKAISEAMGRKLVFIPMNTADIGSIIGRERIIPGAEPGRIATELAECGSDNVIFLLDELDKAQVDVCNAFLAMLDSKTNVLLDKFVDFPMDMTNVMFIATSNETRNIPVALLDRLSIIEFKDYTIKEKSDILFKMVFPGYLERYGLKEFTVDEEMCRYICETYGQFDGMRSIINKSEKILNRVLLERELGNAIVLDRKFVDEALGPKPISKPFATEILPGMVRALAVYGSIGLTFEVQVSESEEDIVTGLPKQSVLDSINLAKHLVSKSVGKEIKHPLHIHFTEAGVEKEGPSAGIAIFLAIYSYISGISIPNEFAFTGEIDLHGNIRPVGGVDKKILGAINDGCTKVFVPTANYKVLSEGGTLDRYSCEIVPISSIADVLMTIMKRNDQ